MGFYLRETINVRSNYFLEGLSLEEPLHVNSGCMRMCLGGVARGAPSPM